MFLLPIAGAGSALHAPITQQNTTGTDEQCRQCKQINAMVSGEFARSPMGSVTVGVVSGNKLVWTRSYDNAESETSESANQNTAYRIGSITKMFTATMLEQLVEAGEGETNWPCGEILGAEAI